MIQGSFWKDCRYQLKYIPLESSSVSWVFHKINASDFSIAESNFEVNYELGLSSYRLILISF